MELHCGGLVHLPNRKSNEMATFVAHNGQHLKKDSGSL